MIVFYYLLYFGLDETFKQSITISHAVPILSIFIYCFLFGLHAFALNMAPIAYKFHSFVSFVYLEVISGISDTISFLWTKDKSDSHSKSYIDFFLIFSPIVSNSFLIEKQQLFKLSRAHHLGNVCTVAIWLLNFLSRASPYISFTIVLEKIALFQNKIYLTTKDGLISKETISYVEKDKNPLHSSYIELKNIINSIDGYNCTINPHEVFDPNQIIDRTSKVHLIWSIARFFIIPSIFICLAFLYTYRQLHPKIRS